MHRILAPMVLAIAILTAGCGDSDPNKNTKPVGKDAVKPTAGDKTAGTMKAGTTPP